MRRSIQVRLVRAAVAVVLLAAVAVVIAVVARWLMGSPSESSERIGSDPLAVPSGEPLDPATTSRSAETGGPDVSTREAPVPDRAPQAPDPRSFHGRVVMDDGTPIPGARVVAFAAGRVELLDLTDPSHLPDDARETRTDWEGRFRIEGEGLATVVDLFVERPGFGPVVALTRRRGGESVVTLEVGHTIEGRVRETSDEPIPGAQVRVVALIESVLCAREVVANANADFSCGDLPKPGEDGIVSPFWIEARAEGFVPLRRVDSPDLRARSREGLPIELIMNRGATISGVVVDSISHEPLPGARVIAWNPVMPIEAYVSGIGRVDPWSGALVLADQRADGAGRFRFERVPAGAIPGGIDPRSSRGGPNMIAAIADGHSPAIRKLDPLVEGRILELELSCLPACTVRGVVVDSTGAPASGAEVWTWRVSGESLPDGFADETRLATRVGDDGRFEFPCMPARGTWSSTIELRAAFEHSPGWHVRPQASRLVDVVAGGEIDVGELVVPAVRRAAVTVIDPEGLPVAGAAIHGVDSTESARRLATTGRNGRAIVVFGKEEDWDLGRERRIVVRTRGLPPAFPPPFEPDAGELDEIMVQLESPHRLAGFVVDPDGNPVSAASVVVLDGRGSDRDYRCLIGEAGTSGRIGSAVLLSSCRTDATGRFELGELPAPPWRLLAMSSDLRASASIDVGVESDAEIRLRLEPTPSSVDVIVRCVDAATGSPIGRIDVAAIDCEDLTPRDAEIGNGTATFRDVPVGFANLRLLAPGYARVHESFEVLPWPRAAEALLALEPARTVFGSIDDPRIRDARHATLRLLADTKTRSVDVSMESDGSFWEERVEADVAYRVDVSFTTPNGKHSFWLIRGFPTVTIPSATRFAEIRGDLIPAGQISVSHRVWTDSMLVEIVDLDGTPFLAPTSLPLDGIEVVVPVGDFLVGLAEDGVTWIQQRVRVAAHEMPVIQFGRDS